MICLLFPYLQNSLRKNFCHDACMYSTLKMMTTLHELELYYLPASHFSILTHIWVPSECGRWNWGLWQTHAPHEYPETLLPSAQLNLTHPFSHHTPSYPPSLFILTPHPRSPLKTCGGNPLLALLAWYVTKISLLFCTFQLLITLRKLPHTLYARSMSWPSSSHTSIPSRTLLWHETIDLSPSPQTPHSSPPTLFQVRLATAKKRFWTRFRNLTNHTF